MSEINHQALREIAKQATQGEWVAFISTGTGTYAVHTPGDKRCEDLIKWPGFDGQKNAENNARYIAAFNPAVVQALLDEREAQNKHIGELEANLVALAAENAEVKAICDDRRRFIMNVVQLGHIKAPAMKTKSGLETIRIAISPQKPTPATDVFLAEVRAGAFNDLCAAFVRHAKIAGLDDGDTVTLKEAIDALLHCAEQLRTPE